MEGLRAEMRSALANRWGVGRKIDEVVTRTVEENIPLIEREIKAAMLDALRSEDFRKRIQGEIVTAMKNKFSGTFDGVMRAAAKKFAQDTISAKAIADLAKEQAIKDVEV
jgi:hypothetical protein